MDSESATDAELEVQGRKLHGRGSNYGLPHNSAERRRLNLQHQAVKLASGGNCLVSLERYGKGPSDILDICCGSGQWLIEMAKEFPNANLIGVDIVLPEFFEPFPSNCRFLTADVNTPLPFVASSFDIVQMRTVPSIHDRKVLLQEIARVLRKDGHVIFAEPGEWFSGSLKAHPAVVEAQHLICLSPHISASSEDPASPGGKVSKKSWSIAPLIVNMLKDASDNEGRTLFSNVESKSFDLAIGAWPTGTLEAEVGRMMAEVQIGIIDGFRSSFLETNLITPEAFEVLRRDFITETNDPSIELQQLFVYAWARKI